MLETQAIFLTDSQQKAESIEHRDKIRFNISKYDQTVDKGVKQYANLNLARERSKIIKWRAIEDLDQTLIRFESNFTKNGGKVIWAKDKDEALREIQKIVKAKKAKTCFNILIQ